MKRFLIAAAVVLGVLLTAALVLPVALRGRIGETVKREASERLNGQLDFARLDVSLLRHFPHASLDLKGLTLVGTGQFGSDTIVAAERVSMVVDMWSLFGEGGFEVSKVSVARPAVFAHKLSDGAMNWDLLKSPSGADSAAAGEASPFRVALRDVRVTNASLRYQDDSTRVRFSSSPVSLRLKGDLTAPKADLEVWAKAGDIRLVSGSVTLVSKADAQLDAIVEADVARKRFAFLQNTLYLNTIGLSLDGWVDLSEPGAVAMDIKAGCGSVQFKDILSMVPAFYMRDFNNLTASGDLSLSAWVRGKAKGSHLPAFEVKLGVKQGRFQYSSQPKAVTCINLTARVASRGGTLDNAVLEVPELSFEMAGNPLKLSFSASHPLSDLQFAASVAGRLDLEAVGKVYPLAKGTDLNGRITADVRVAGRLSDIDSQRYESVDAVGRFVVEQMHTRLRGLPEVTIRRAAATLTPVTMTLGEFGVTVGQSDLTANGQLTGYIGYLLDGMPLAGRLYVKSEQLDLNEIMAAIPASEASEAADTAATAALIIPRNLNLSLSTDVRKVMLGRMTLADFTGELRTAGGTVALDRLSMKALGGSILASGSYSTALDTEHPDLTLALDIVHASFARTYEELEVIRRFAPLFQQTVGNYSMTLDLTAVLDRTMTPDLRTLTARGEIRSANIRIPNIEAFSKLADVLHNNRLRTIDASDVTIRFTVQDGRVTTQPFDLRMGDVRLGLEGSTGFDRTIDYSARVTLPGAAAGSLLPAIDVGIGGTFDAPKVTLGVQQAVQDAVRKLLK